MMSRTTLLFVITGTVGLSSCATISKVGKGSVALVKNTTTATTSKVSDMSELAMNKVMPPRIKVVEVREKDLQELQTGHEKALAFENTRKRGFWSSVFTGPVDFIEPNLPEPGVGDENVDVLLPPAD